MSADIDSLYKNAPAVLWVEDPETRAWLDTLWRSLSPTILVRVAGGHQHVNAVCAQAVDAGWRHIFGLVDQDFGTSNYYRWTSLASHERVYRLDVHETENLLIDPSALAGCVLNTGRRTVREVETHLYQAAQLRTWWVACARFLADTSRNATDGFPPTPGPLSSLAEAEAHVHGSEWFQRTATRCPALADRVAVTAALQTAHSVATTALTDGSWRTSFPGKQIFREVSGFVQPNAPGTSARLDLAKAVGAWQLVHGVPRQATELRQSILARI